MFSFLNTIKLKLIFVGIFAVLLANSVHNSYPDEFDNISGGYLITQGILPYTGFFSHHAPLAYFLSAAITLFSGQSFIKFRLFSALFLFLFFIVCYRILRKRLGAHSIFFLVFIALFSFSATYFWGHMFLADSLSALLLAPGYALFLAKVFFKAKLDLADLVVISLSTSASVVNSLTYLYAATPLVIGATIYTLHSGDVLPGRLRTSVVLATKTILIFALPYLIFFGYLLATSSLPDFLFQAVDYNRQYYIYNYPRPPGSTSFNPVRYAVVIVNNFINGYQPLLAFAKNPDFMNPFNTTLAVSNTVFWVFLLLRKKFFLLFISLVATVFSTVRSSDLVHSKPTDYQLAVYFNLSFLNATFFAVFIAKEIETIKTFLAKAASTSLALLFALFWITNVVFLFAEFWRMNYSRYMGTMPLIYDRPAVAPIVNNLLGKSDYCWVGPFEFEEIFYLDCRLPSKYHWILPQFGSIEKIKSAMLADFSQNPPDVIVFRRNFSAFGQTPDFNRFFVDFLDKNYLRLSAISGFEKYHFRDNYPKDFNLDEDFNFPKTSAEKLAENLAARGIIAQKAP